MMDLIFFGMQGAGKGTLGKSIAKAYDMEIFETGGQLRKLSQEDSDLGRKIKSIIEAGNLVPNEVVMEMVEDFMKTLSPNTSILFDGIPRSVEQAQTLNALLSENKRKYKAVLIDIKRETALKRLTTRRICKVCKSVFPSTYEAATCTCGGELITRSDDNPEAIETRLEAFEKETIPAIEIYNDRLIKINGEPSISEVEKMAIETLNSIMS